MGMKQGIANRPSKNRALVGTQEKLWGRQKKPKKEVIGGTTENQRRWWLDKATDQCAKIQAPKNQGSNQKEVTTQERKANSIAVESRDSKHTQA